MSLDTTHVTSGHVRLSKTQVLLCILISVFDGRSTGSQWSNVPSCGKLKVNEYDQ